jgi:hypothetical protein
MHLTARVAGALCWLLGVVAMPVAAQEHCSGLSNSRPKAVCFTQNRRSYGAALERALFEIPSNGNVFVQEEGEPERGRYPRLVIWTTLLTEDKMNELIAKGAILDGARKVGFRMLVFVDKGQDRNWYFDLTKPANSPLEIAAPPSPAWMRRGSR